MVRDWKLAEAELMRELGSEQECSRTYTGIELPHFGQFSSEMDLPHR